MEKKEETQLELQMEKTPKLDMRKCRTNSSFKLIVSERLEGKIRYLCDRFPNTEWSGIMFYKEQSGNLEDKNLVLVAEDFYLLDVGTAGYTEYEVTPEVFSYQLDNDLLDCWWSILHSHDSMAAFFSGTDVNTLNKIGSTMNHCVSLIVNNAGKYVARITRIVDESYECLATGSYNSFNNDKKEFRYSFGGNKKLLEYIDADIEIQEPKELSEDEKEFLEKRIADIDEAKKQKRQNFAFTSYDKWLDFESGDSIVIGNNDNNLDLKAKPDLKKSKQLVYSLITGDLFPLASIINRSKNSVVENALNVYNVKKRMINSVADDDNAFDNYIFTIMNYHINDPENEQSTETINNALSILFDYAAKDEWINKLYETLIMYGY